MNSFYQNLTDKYDIPILDCTYMDISYDTTYFYSASHLNRPGSEIFSDNLANDLLKMGIVKQLESDN